MIVRIKKKQTKQLLLCLIYHSKLLAQKPFRDCYEAQVPAPVKMTKQLSLFTENKRGALKKITKTLKTADININTMLSNDSAEYGIIRMINFAHGDFIMIGSYTLFYTIPSQAVDGTLQVKIPIPKSMKRDIFIKAFFKDESAQSGNQLRLKLGSNYKIS